MPDEPLHRGKKRDTDAPRGVSRHPSGGWAIRFACGAGCTHKERVGPLKSEAIRLYHERRNRALSEPGWCPNVERRNARAETRAASFKASQRVSFKQYAGGDYLPWAKLHHRGYATDVCRVGLMVETFGARMLDELAPADVDRFLDGLLKTRKPHTVNRYRTTLQAMFSRAKRHGLVSMNPVQGIERHPEPEGAVKYLMADEERALRESLASKHRDLFVISLNTGLRWSEQARLTWRCVDFLSGVITVEMSKNGRSRQVPMNSVVRSILVDLSTARQRLGDPRERVFTHCPGRPDDFFPKAVERARKLLTEAGVSTARLDGFTWHGNRHTFASRLVMAGVDLRAVQVLGGWRTLGMVQRYSHLAPAHLMNAVERLVPSATEASRMCPEPSRSAVDAR
jgi:site-specific recombinase XerD